MTTLLIQLPLPLGSSLCVLFIWLIAILVYFITRLVMRNWLLSQSVSERDTTVRIADSVFRMSGTLMALIISLSFNGLRNDYSVLRDTIHLESAQILDIAIDLKSYGTPKAQALTEQLKRYTRLVIDQEWPSMPNGEADWETLQTFNELQIGIHNLEADTPSKSSLRQNLITDIDEVSDYRQFRLFQALPDPLQFLFVALVGFLCTIASFSVYEFGRARVMLAGTYCLLIGVVVYAMLALANSFEGPMALTPRPMEVAYLPSATCCDH
jgi:hypothetical protein